MEAFHFQNLQETRNPLLGLGYDTFQRSRFMSSQDDPLCFDDVSRREVSKVPFKVLDAPSLSDDFYLNLVDWSEQNFLAVGLGH